MLGQRQEATPDAPDVVRALTAAIDDLEGRLEATGAGLAAVAQRMDALFGTLERWRSEVDLQLTALEERCAGLSTTSHANGRRADAATTLSVALTDRVGAIDRLLTDTGATIRALSARLDAAARRDERLAERLTGVANAVASVAEQVRRAQPAADAAPGPAAGE